eukprot:6973019-Alexandrium_andersonii.AAC.1
MHAHGHDHARRLLQKVKAIEPVDIQHQVNLVVGAPPTEPNVYTDGTSTRPRELTCSTAGAGVWWPGR